MVRSKLDEIGQRNGTDKSSSHHDYLRHYEAQISLLNIPVVSLLEIGVLGGSSVRTWHEFLADAKIVGLDINVGCKEFEGPGISIDVCDQSDPSQLTAAAVKYGPFDIIIDDGSHMWCHQILTFETLFPFLRPGGLFIIEDIDTSFGYYVDTYGGNSSISAAEYVIKLANWIMASTAKPLNEEPDIRMRAFVPLIDSITMIRRSALIFKKLT